MSTTVKVSLSSNFTTPDNGSDVILVLNSKEQLQDLSTNSDISKLLQLSSDHGIALVKATVNRLTVSTDSAVAGEFLLPASGDVYRRFVVVLLPSACSRHNTPSKAHALTQAIKNSKGSDNLLVVLLSNSASTAFAQACSVSRQFPTFTQKSGSPKKDVEVNIVVHLPAGEVVEERFEDEANSTVANIRLAQRLVDMPPNLLHTDAYVEECRSVAAQLGCKITVIQGFELEEKGFGGLWGVGKASEHLPALVVLSHVPAGQEDAKSICMVGKGIVYDTGGLSIKTPTTNMAGMKVDMGGSAAVLGAFATAVTSMKLNSPLHALLCISENSVGPLSIRPDDVQVFLSGKTVEVNNTDAEGRLVLADGCFYAHRDLNPRVIIDIATLTGAQLIATGKNHAAIYCNDDELEAVAVRAGKATGDLTFPIPYCPEFYRNEFRSQVADMKNSVADRGNAQSSCAGQFIGNHLEDYLSQGGKWLHVDMAGPVEVAGRATGYGVALLSRIVKELQ